MALLGMKHSSSSLAGVAGLLMFLRTTLPLLRVAWNPKLVQLLLERSGALTHFEPFLAMSSFRVSIPIFVIFTSA